MSTWLDLGCDKALFGLDLGGGILPLLFGRISVLSGRVTYTTLYHAASSSSLLLLLLLPYFCHLFTHSIICCGDDHYHTILAWLSALAFICLLAFVLTLMMCDERRFLILEVDFWGGSLGLDLLTFLLGDLLTS
jgi:hypothetical protein